MDPLCICGIVVVIVFALNRHRPVSHYMPPFPWINIYMQCEMHQNF